MEEYELYIPLVGNGNSNRLKSPIEEAKKELVGYFGGLTDTRHRNEGLWRVGRVTYRDEIVIWRILSDKAADGERFISTVATKLRERLGQEELLVTKRKIDTLVITKEKIDMNIYEALKKDHDELQSVLDKLAAAESAESRHMLIEKVRDLLVPHSRAEEAVFYNVLRDHDEAKDLFAHAYAEHVKAETLLRGLQVTDTIALRWKSGVEKLKMDISHHIAEEEGKVFSAAKRALSDEEAKAIGTAFKKLKPEMGAGLIQSNVELIANLMPSRLRKSFVDNVHRDSHNASREAL